MLYILPFDKELATTESKALFKNTIISKLHSRIFAFKRTKLWIYETAESTYLSAFHATAQRQKRAHLSLILLMKSLWSYNTEVFFNKLTLNFKELKNVNILIAIILYLWT